MKLDLVHRSNTARDAFAHLLAIGICTAVLFLFVALTYTQITLPRYITKYSEKDVQQVINLIVAIVATFISILFSHCRRLTNEAETKTELRTEKLTIPRLHVHFEAASGTKVAMGVPVARNKQVWRLVAFYFLAMIIFGFVHSVLSVIFVIEPIISEKGELVPVAIPLSVDMPMDYTLDPCSTNIDNPECTYVLALQALSSQLVAYQSYSIAGVTFEPPNGTLGLPYYAMRHFSKEVSQNKFDDARRRYCLPVMDPDIWKCREVPINHTTCESTDPDHFVRYKSLNVSEYYPHSGETRYEGTGLYKIASPFPNDLDNWGSTKLRIDQNGRGIMVVQVFAPDPYSSLVGAANAWGEHGYASLLHRLMYNGQNPNTSTVPDGATYDFAARCTMTPIMHQDNLRSSWRQVDFTLKSGVLRANVTDERCPNARAFNGKGWSGFADLAYALELASVIISNTDGYTKFFNEHPPTGMGTHYFANMSRLDTIVNQMYHIVQTYWTASMHEYAMANPIVHDHPVMMTSYPHVYIIRISWTPTTWVGLVLSLLVALMSWVLAIRWVLAIYHFGFGAETWNLLRPIDLMAYSLAASEDLISSLDTTEHRKMEMRGTTRTFLRERPMDLLRFMTGTVTRKTASESSSSSPESPVREHPPNEPTLADEVGPGVPAPARQTDLESGTRRTKSARI